MADISIVAANVLPSTSATYRDGTAGGTITAGQPVYQDAADSKKWKAADANASAATAEAVGIALHGASAGQPLRVQVTGLITIGGTVVVGTIYIVSANAGGIAPSSDQASGWYTTILGVATTTGIISLGIKVSGVAKP